MNNHLQKLLIGAEQQAISTTNVINDLCGSLAVRLKPVDLSWLALVGLEQPASPEPTLGVTCAIVHTPTAVYAIRICQDRELLILEAPHSKAIFICQNEPLTVLGQSHCSHLKTHIVVCALTSWDVILVNGLRLDVGVVIVFGGWIPNTTLAYKRTGFIKGSDL